MRALAIRGAGRCTPAGAAGFAAFTGFAAFAVPADLDALLGLGGVPDFAIFCGRAAFTDFAARAVFAFAIAHRS
jgi:hypothetical protein